MPTDGKSVAQSPVVVAMPEPVAQERRLAGQASSAGPTCSSRSPPATRCGPASSTRPGTRPAWPVCSPWAAPPAPARSGKAQHGRRAARAGRGQLVAARGPAAEVPALRRRGRPGQPHQRRAAVRGGRDRVQRGQARRCTLAALYLDPPPPRAGLPVRGDARGRPGQGRGRRPACARRCSSPAFKNELATVGPARPPTARSAPASPHPIGAPQAPPGPRRREPAPRAPPRRASTPARSTRRWAAGPRSPCRAGCSPSSTCPARCSTKVPTAGRR